MKPLISVVIPVYNAEKFIGSCIESVCAQTFDNWELILVDDGSSDESGTICDFYASKDSRITIFHKKNGGVSSARNYGLDKANGLWVTFIDSDDFIDKCFFEIFEKRCQKKCFDLFMGDVKQISLNEESFIEYGLRTTVCSLKEAIIDDKILRSGDLHAKMFKTNIIENNKIAFCEQINYSEDRLFFDSYLTQVDNIALDSSICYFYKRNNAGLSYKLNSFESEWLCYENLRDTLYVVAQKSSLDCKKLLHTNPALRVLKAALSEKNGFSFSCWFQSLGKNDNYFFSTAIGSMRLGKFFQKLLSLKMYQTFFYFLKAYEFVKKVQKSV